LQPPRSRYMRLACFKLRLGLDDGRFLSFVESKDEIVHVHDFDMERKESGNMWARILEQNQDEVRRLEAKLNSTHPRQ
jgi:hypothetical protein